jgi:Tol biopolymer transport system component
MNIRAAIGIVSIGAAALLGATPSTSAASTTQSDNGPIVFTLELPDSQQLQVLDPANGSPRALTRREGADAVAPDWSPSGRLVVFEADSKNRAMISLVRADGTHRRTIHPGLAGYLGQPAFVPHSNLIVFERNVPGTGDDSLWLMGRDGTHARRLTTNPFPGQGADTDPNVSPDGRTVSFVRISVFDDQQALYSVRLDGSHLRRVLPYAADVGIKHDWAPDGRHIVVSLNANEGSRPHASANVAVLRPDGSHLRRLTHFKGRDVNALVGGYSPDGQWIIYRVETGDGDGTLPGGQYALMKLSPHGGQPVLVAAVTGRPRSSDWGGAAH